MTDTPKTVQFSPEEWRGLAILNATQLHSFLSSIPATTEENATAFTPGHAALVESHLERLRMFLNGWSRARAPTRAMAEEKAVAVEQPAEAHAGANGAASKRRGGWPKGKSRRQQPAQVQ